MPSSPSGVMPLSRGRAFESKIVGSALMLPSMRRIPALFTAAASGPIRVCGRPLDLAKEPDDSAGSPAPTSTREPLSRPFDAPPRDPREKSRVAKRWRGPKWSRKAAVVNSLLFEASSSGLAAFDE